MNKKNVVQTLNLCWVQNSSCLVGIFEYCTKQHNIYFRKQTTAKIVYKSLLLTAFKIQNKMYYLSMDRNFLKHFLIDPLRD
jgi:hypothetical protein